MKTEVNFYGQLADISGCRSMQVSADRVGDLLEQLYSLYPLLRAKSFLTAIDTTIVNEDAVIMPGSTVSLLPPFAGG